MMTNMHRIIGGTVAVAATVMLVACGGEDSQPVASQTESVSQSAKQDAAPAPVAAPAVSKLAPNLTLPAGSKEDDPNNYPDLELWRVPTTYAATVENLEPQLPIKQDYDGLAWCEKDINTKLNITQWSWGGSGKDTLVVVANDDGTVTVTRGLDDSDQRAGCDVPTPGGAPLHSELAGISLPAGSASVELFKPDPTMEEWSLPGSHEDAIKYLLTQLPVGRAYQSMKWCSKDGDDEYVDWAWGDTDDLLQVHLLDSQLTITRGPNSYGCI